MTRISIRITSWSCEVKDFNRVTSEDCGLCYEHDEYGVATGEAWIVNQDD